MGGHLRVKRNSHSDTRANKKLAMSQHSALHACYTRTGFPWFRGKVSDLRPFYRAHPGALAQNFSRRASGKAYGNYPFEPHPNDRWDSYATRRARFVLRFTSTPA